MTPPDIATTLRKVSALRSLCLRLPHVPTPAEKRLLERFEALTAAPTRATAADIEAIAVGWSGWWRGGNTAAVLDMAARIPVDLIEASQTASSIWAGAARDGCALGSPWTRLRGSLRALDRGGPPARACVDGVPAGHRSLRVHPRRSRIGRSPGAAGRVAQGSPARHRWTPAQVHQ